MGDGVSGRGGSRTLGSLTLGSRTAVGLICGLGLLSALGGAACSSDSAPSREEFIAELTSDGTFDETQATCIADGLEREGVSFGAFSDVSDEDIDSGNLSEVEKDEDFAAVQAVVVDCFGFGDLAGTTSSSAG